ncbi:Ig-like domain-containing protein [Porphyromonadaceae bacterium W3.11]|nr:Ig-like domain-containing protein [Porphyromonadaceae bacterium W3.11]
MKRNLFHLFSLVAALLAFTMCTPEEEVAIKVESIQLNNSIVTLKEGSKTKLEVAVSPINIKDYSIQWFVSDNTIASVSEMGEITAIQEGETTVTAKTGAAFATCLVRVSSLNVPLEKIEFSEKEVEVQVGASMMLSLMLTPENTTDQIEWNSSNQDVAKVSNGKVVGVKVGSAMITASSGDIKASITVNVVPQPIEVTSLKFAESKVTVEEGTSIDLKVNVESNDPENVKLNWASEHADIAKVVNGKVTGVKEGTTKITVSYGELKDECTVEVTKKTIVVKSLTLDKNELSLKENQSATLVATVEPVEYLNQIKWRSENDEIATVSKFGQVKAVGEGETKIIASVGDKEAICNVTVDKALTKDDFTVELSEVKPLNAVFTIKPSSDDIVYTWDVMTKKVYDDIVSLHGSKYKADRAFWDYAGDQAFQSDIHHGTITSNLLERGKVGMPNTEYILCYYAVDKETRELASPIIEYSFRTAKSTKSSNEIKFTQEKIEPKAIFGKITTTNEDGYYITVQKKSYVDYYVKKKESGELIDGNDPLETMFMKCIEGDIKYVDIDYIIRKGDMSIDDQTFPDRKPKYDYYLLIIGFDKEKGFCTDPILHQFTTPAAN